MQYNTHTYRTHAFSIHTTYIPPHTKSTPHITAPHTKYTQQQAGDCLDLSVLLCSMLLGCNYDAYVVTGYTTAALAQGDCSGVECDCDEWMDEEEEGEEERIGVEGKTGDEGDVRGQQMVMAATEESSHTVVNAHENHVVVNANENHGDVDQSDSTEAAACREHEHVSHDADATANHMSVHWHRHAWVLVKRDPQRQVLLYILEKHQT